MKSIKVAIFLVVACIWLVANAQQTGEQGGLGGNVAGAQQGGAMSGQGSKLSGIWLTDDNKFSFAVRHVGNLIYAYGARLPGSQQGGAAGGTPAQGGAANQTTEGGAAGANATQSEQPASNFVIIFNGVVAESSQSGSIGGMQGAGENATVAQGGAAGAQVNQTQGGAAGAQSLGLISGSFAVVPVDRTALESWDQSGSNMGFGVVAIQISDNNTLTIIQSNHANMTTAKLTRYQGTESGGAGAGGAQQQEQPATGQ